MVSDRRVSIKRSRIAIQMKLIISLEDNVGMTQMPEEWIGNIPLPDIPNFDPEWNEKYFMRKN